MGLAMTMPAVGSLLEVVLVSVVDGDSLPSVMVIAQRKQPVDEDGG